MRRVFLARRVVSQWVSFLLCSGVGLTTPRRIGQAPRISEKGPGSAKKSLTAAGRLPEQLRRVNCGRRDWSLPLPQPLQILDGPLTEIAKTHNVSHMTFSRL